MSEVYEIGYTYGASASTSAYRDRGEPLYSASFRIRDPSPAVIARLAVGSSVVVRFDPDKPTLSTVTTDGH